MSLSKTLYLSAPYQTAYSITTDNSDLEKLLRMRYGRYLTDESEDGRQYRSVVISKYRRAFNMQCGEKLYRTARDILGSPTRLASMSRGMAELGILDATERIYNTVMELVK